MIANLYIPFLALLPSGVAFRDGFFAMNGEWVTLVF